MKALLFLLLASMPAAACLNNYIPNERAIRDSRTLLEAVVTQSLIEPWPAREKHLREVGHPTPEDRNDLAVAMLHNGKSLAAIPILEQIETEVPGRYQTATNLGTAYELSGQDGKALWWIEEGIRRNPLSHEGSEWIHVAVLRKKIEFAVSGLPGSVDSILGIDDELTQLPPGNQGEPQTIPQIIAGLSHQLHERIPFVPPPDYYVAALLFDLGRLHARVKHDAASSYDIYALGFDYAHGFGEDKIERRLSESGVRRHFPRSRPPMMEHLGAILGSIWLVMTIPFILLNAVRHRRDGRARTCALLKCLGVTTTLLLINTIGVLLGSLLDFAAGALGILVLLGLSIWAAVDVAKAIDRRYRIAGGDAGAAPLRAPSAVA